MPQNKRESLVNLLRDFFQKNAPLWPLEMVFLYGSRAEGLPRPDSDVDIGILFRDEVKSDAELFDLTTIISLSLSRAIRMDVNVIPVYPDLRKPMLYFNVIVRGIPVFVRDYARYADLRNEAIYQMEDFEIFGKEWNLTVSRKNLERLGYAGI